MLSSSSGSELTKISVLISSKFDSLFHFDEGISESVSMRISGFHVSSGTQKVLMQSVVLFSPKESKFSLWGSEGGVHF